MNLWGTLILKIKAARTILEVGESRENSIMKAKQFKCVKKEEVSLTM